jgi:hypothetical protein
MYYISTLDAHEFHGPFMSREKAKAYAELKGFSSYSIETDAWCQRYHAQASLRLVPQEYRA